MRRRHDSSLWLAHRMPRQSSRRTLAGEDEAARRLRCREHPAIRPWTVALSASPRSAGDRYGGSVRIASAVNLKSGFALAKLDLDRLLKDEASYQQKLRLASGRDARSTSVRALGEMRRGLQTRNRSVRRTGIFFARLLQKRGYVAVAASAIKEITHPVRTLSWEGRPDRPVSGRSAAHRSAQKPSAISRNADIRESRICLSSSSSISPCFLSRVTVRLTVSVVRPR